MHFANNHSNLTYIKSIWSRWIQEFLFLFHDGLSYEILS